MTDWSLKEEEKNTWSNTILWELGKAVGMIPEDAVVFSGDVENILDLSLEYIWRYRELEDS